MSLKIRIQKLESYDLDDGWLENARREFVGEFGKPKEEHLAASIAVYQACIDDPRAKRRDKIKAQERIDKLLGLRVNDKAAETVVIKVERDPNWYGNADAREDAGDGQDSETR